MKYVDVALIEYFKTSHVLMARILGYALALYAVISIERIHGDFGLATYGVLLIVTAATRYVALGIPDLYLLRGAKTNESSDFTPFARSLILVVLSSLLISLLGLGLAYLILADDAAEFGLNYSNWWIIPLILIVRSMSSLVVADERIRGGILILSLSYVLPYSFEIWAIFTSNTENIGISLFLAHLFSHVVLVIINLSRKRQKISYLYLKRQVYSINRRFVFVKIVLFQGLALTQFSIVIYGGVLLVRYLASATLSVEEFAVFTLLFSMAQAAQNLSNTPVTVSQAGLIRKIKSGRLHKVNGSVGSGDIRMISFVIAFIWLTVVLSSGLLVQSQLFELPEIYLVALGYLPNVALAYLYLDLSFVSVISLQLRQRFTRFSFISLLVAIITIIISTSYGRDASFFTWLLCWQVAAIAFLLSSFSLVAFGNTLKGFVSHQIRKHFIVLGFAAIIFMK